MWHSHRRLETKRDIKRIMLNLIVIIISNLPTYFANGFEHLWFGLVNAHAPPEWAVGRRQPVFDLIGIGRRFSLDVETRFVLDLPPLSSGPRVGPVPSDLPDDLPCR
jgi:hypothetical protein